MKTSLLSVYFFLILGILLLSLGLYLETDFYKDKIYPNTYINNIDVSGLTTNEALKKLNKNQKISSHKLSLVVDGIKVSSSSAELNVSVDYPKAIDLAYANNKDKQRYQSAINLLSSLFSKKNIDIKPTYKEDKLENLISSLSKKVFLKGENPDISLKISGNSDYITVFKGKAGREINIESTKKSIKNKINDYKNNTEEIIVDATVASTSAVLSDDQINLEIARAKLFVGKNLEVKAEDNKYQLNDVELISLIEPLKKYKDKKIDELILKWSEEINREAQDAEFAFNEDTLEVSTFKPHKDGLEIDRNETKKTLVNWLESIEGTDENNKENYSIDVSLKKTAPQISLESTNDLGINERIGFGESYYHHSIINRVHNVGITSDRISLTIVPPGEEFSFNKTLGEVSSQTGYRSAYVISGGKTVLGDGGGVCQVSSTLFRAVLDAGLKVTKRLQHSYRVSYYELNSQPGFDATVYAGDVDFRFVNDTDHHILIYSYTNLDDRYMKIEIYGTDDGRTTEITNYKKWDFRRPPAAEYYPTTSLPTGVTKQVDWSVSGIKTEFTHIIRDKDNNVTNEEVYYSNYRPWSAKYMIGI